MTHRVILVGLAFLAGCAAPAFAQAPVDAFRPFLNAYDLRDLAADGAGNLWIASNGGVHRLRLSDRAWTAFPARRAGGPVGNDVTAVEVDPGGTVWVGTANRGASTFDPATRRWERFEEMVDLRVRVIRAFGTRLFLGTENGMSLRFRPNRTDLCNDVAVGCIVPSYVINDYAMLGDTLWVATARGLGRFDGERWNAGDELPAGSVGGEARSLAVFEGALWAAFPDAVRRLDGATWTATAGIAATRLVATGGRLFMLAADGMREWTGGEWAAFAPPLEGGSVVADLEIVPLAGGAPLFAFAGPGGIHLWQEGEAAQRIVPPGPQIADFHRGIAVDDACAVWVGNQEGLMRFEEDAWTFFPKGANGLDGEWIFSMISLGDAIAMGHCCCDAPPRCRTDILESGAFANVLDANDVWSLAVDGAGRVWAGTNDDGAYVLEQAEDGSWSVILRITNASTGGKLRSNSIRAIAVTAQGTYFGHAASLGLDYWPHGGNPASGADGTGWETITTGSGLADGSVGAIATNGPDVWVGTATALHRLSGRLVVREFPTNFSDIPGDLPRGVRAIVPDARGGIWCATSDGLLHLPSRDAVAFRRYGTDNADLPSDDLLSAASNPCDGSIWFGAALGVLRIDPALFYGGAEEEPRFIVYPNPFLADPTAQCEVRLGYFAAPNVVAAGSRVRDAAVYDVTGRQVGSFTVSGEEWIWKGQNENGDFVVPGLYLVAFTTESGARETLKLAVRRDALPGESGPCR